jgi:spermidine synthase
VFPHATLWHDGQLLVGSLGPLHVNPAAIEARMTSPVTRAAIEAVGFHGIDTLAAWYTAGPDAMRRFVGDGPILTDDRPLLEYSWSLPGGPPAPDMSPLTGRLEEVLGR